jgi:hypothetical protein
MGHELGLPDLTAASDVNDLMHIDLVDGERRLPTTADVAQAGGGTFSFAAVGTTAPADAAPASAAAPIGGGHGGHPLLDRLADNFHFAHVSADGPAPLPQTHAATDSSLVRGGAFDFSGLRSHASDIIETMLHVVPEAGGFLAQLHDMVATRHGAVTPASGWSGLAPMFGAHAGDHVNALPISPLLASYLAQHVDLHI